MKQHVQHVYGQNVTLDDLLALVEKVTRAIEHLHAENLILTAQASESKMISSLLESELATQAERYQELEQAVAALRKDADWCAWFRGKYGNSTFFQHIERTYLSECADKAEDTDSGIAPPAAAWAAGTAHGA